MAKREEDNEGAVEILVPGFFTSFPREIPFGEITVGECQALFKEEGMCFPADGGKKVVRPEAEAE